MKQQKTEANVLKKLQSAWASYKDETRSSQAKAAKALGMNQSAFSQYLRGEIGTNTDFVNKFEALTGVAITEKNNIEQAVYGFALPIRCSLSGVEPTAKRVMVESLVTSPDCYGVIADIPSIFEQGSVVVVDPKAEIREGDVIALIEEFKATIGNVRLNNDGWYIAVPSWGHTEQAHLSKNSEVVRVSSSYYPQKDGRKVVSLN